MSSPPMFEADGLAVRYPNGELALHNVSFSINAPSFTAIIGPNGSGNRPGITYSSSGVHQDNGI